MRFSKHHMCGTRIYTIWNDMKCRCKNPNLKNYKHYGGRGIKVCEEWDCEDGFNNFYAWAVANGYQDNLTIDRIDVNGDYTPDNCRWSTKSTQNANRRSIGKCEYIGVSKTGNRYLTSIKKDNKKIFLYSSRSKNDCARKRNEYIVSHNLLYPLNDIKDEYEDIIPYKNDNVYFVAVDKETGKRIEKKSQKELATELGISTYFIYQCCNGKRNSKKYIFSKEVRG